MKPLPLAITPHRRRQQPDAPQRPLPLTRVEHVALRALEHAGIPWAICLSVVLPWERREDRGHATHPHAQA